MIDHVMQEDLIFVVVVGSETSNEQGTSTNQLLAVSSNTDNVPVTSVEATTSQPSSRY